MNDDVYSRQQFGQATGLGEAPALLVVDFVNGFADGVPGYIPPEAEYPFGGYEVLEAHRYYGLPAAFAAGSAERLEAAAIRLNAQLDRLRS